MNDRHFLLRCYRATALVPARLRWISHEPGEPDNHLDRGRLSPFPLVEVAGRSVPPEFLLERLGMLATNGDVVQPADVLLARLAVASPIPVTHWKYPQPIGRAEYDYQIARLGWAERNRPSDPTLRPRQPVDPNTFQPPLFV